MITGSHPSTDEHEVLVLERAALARWCRGDPSGFLDITDDEVGYFDPFLPHRLDGLAALTDYYEGLRGTVSAIAWDILEPRVVEIGEAAVLSFRFRAWAANGTAALWTCTEVWRRRPAGWRIAQTHWSLAATEAV